MNEERTDQDTEENEARPRPGIWDLLVAEDQTELDLEQLAAFTEGRLPPAEHEELRRLVARSPRAMDLVGSLQEFMRAEAAGETPTLPVEPCRVVQSAPRSFEHWRTLALAASVLIVASAGYLAMYYHREGQLVAMNELTGQVQQFHTGDRVKGLGRQPEQTIDELLHRGRTLGSPPVEAAPLAELLAAAKADVLNLEAAELFQNASSCEQEKRASTFAQAVARLKDAERLAPQHAPTYFNLMLVYRALGQPDKAAEARQKFLQYETRPAYREAAQRLLDQPQ